MLTFSIIVKRLLFSYRSTHNHIVLSSHMFRECTSATFDLNFNNIHLILLCVPRFWINNYNVQFNFNTS